jgi:hypothetical protein
MLGYAKVETGTPDPAKSIAYLKRYAELEPGQPNPEDSLGEVSRYSWDDQGSLVHYAAALKLSADPRSPLTLKWLAIARQNAGDTHNAEAGKLRLKFLRAPTAEWYLVTRQEPAAAN